MAKIFSSSEQQKQVPSQIDDQINYDRLIQEPIGQFGRYSFFALIVIELAMAVVAGSMLSPTFHKIKPEWTCADPRFVGGPNNCSCTNRSYHADDTGFYSYTWHFELVCNDTYLSTLLSTLLMVGGLGGAIFFGAFADRFGRKYGGIITLSGVAIFTLVFIFSPSYPVSVILFMMMGFFGGGYMVVGIVTVIEYVGRDYRMLTSCFHGWPYGLMSMGLIGLLTKNWKYYHITYSVLLIPFIILWFFFTESPRWLIRMNRLDEAMKTLERIAKCNGIKDMPIKMHDLEKVYAAESANRDKNKGYDYLDLFKYRDMRKNILTLTYLWFSSGLVSWGIYSNASFYPGITYVNVFLIGLAKGLAGLIIPMVFEKVFKLGRRPTILSGLTVVVLAMWGVAIAYFVQPYRGGTLGPMVTACAIIGVAAVDPTWKILHLYANELFPTVIRNMANAVCNMGSRTSSIIAPNVAFLEEEYLAAPYVIFAILAMGQFILAYLFMPETYGKPLKDNIPPKEAKGQGNTVGSASPNGESIHMTE